MILKIPIFSIKGVFIYRYILVLKRILIIEIMSYLSIRFLIFYFLLYNIGYGIFGLL